MSSNFQNLALIKQRILNYMSCLNTFISIHIIYIVNSLDQEISKIFNIILLATVTRDPFRNLIRTKNLWQHNLHRKITINVYVIKGSIAEFIQGNTNMGDDSGEIN